MTDNVPATYTPPPAPVVAQDTDSWTQIVGEVAKLAGHIADTEFVPKGLRGSPAATAAAILYGREVGLPPMTALTQTFVVEGRPSLSAEAMRGLIYAQGHELEYPETTGARCVVRGRRRGSQSWTTVEWNIDMARAAGLMTKNNWKSYPRAMLVARATAELCRLIFPDVIHGFAAAEELQDSVDAEPVTDAPQATSKVSRSRKRALPASPAAAFEQPAPEPSSPPAAPPAVPLPGEEGYELGSHAVEGGGSPAAGEPTPEPEVVEEGDVEVEELPEGVVVEEELPVEAEVVQEANEEKPPPSPPASITKAQLSMLHASMGKTLGLAGDEHRDERLGIVSSIVGREVESTADLSKVEGSKVIDTIARAGNLPSLLEVLAGIEQARTAKDQA